MEPSFPVSGMNRLYRFPEDAQTTQHDSRETEFPRDILHEQDNVQFRHDLMK